MNKIAVGLLIPLALISFGGQADTLAQLQKCADTKDSLIRLVCYDQVMKSLNNAPVEMPKQTVIRPTKPVNSAQEAVPLRPTADKVIVTKQANTQEDSFGIEHIEHKVNNEKLNEVVFVINSLKKTARDKWLITFTNQQVWQQTDSEFLKLAAGDKVELSKGVLGAVYLKKMDKNKKIRVKRKK